MSFDAGDASGWDECLPSVAACTVPYDGENAEIPDHGDLWRVAWDTPSTRDEGPGTYSTIAHCFSLPLELARHVTVSQTERGYRIWLAYRLTNRGPVPAPWSWSAHPLFLAQEGDRIVLPDGIHSLRVEGSAGSRLGGKGDFVNWPIANLTKRGETDLSVALSAHSGAGDKLFAGPLDSHQTWCQLIRASAGVKIRVGFDSAATPYLGLWLCYGGWPDRDGPKQTCVAIEPSTAPVDSLAETGPWSRQLAPGKSVHWTMSVDVESL
jgi:galactose mutarotase-like enzyme